LKGTPAIMAEVLRGVLSSSREMPGEYRKVDIDLFFLLSLKVITHYYPIIRRFRVLSIGSVVK
jgi:hypothetical protein